MPHYIKEYIANFTEKSGILAPEFFQELYAELQRFDPRDFDPSVQALLVKSRYNLRFVSNRGFNRHSDQQKVVLDQMMENLLVE